MKTKAIRSSLLVTLATILLSLPAGAGSTLYTNGPINGNVDAWNISSYEVSDSFGLASASTIGSIAFGSWIFAGDTPTSVMWSITSSPLGGGTVYASGTSSLTNVIFCMSSPTCGLNLGYNVYTSSFTTNVALGAGSYYLNFTNTGSVDGDLVYWDENSGVGCSGSGCPSTASQTTTGTIPSEAFTLYAPSVPEPDGVSVLFGGGIFAFAGFLVYRLRARLPRPPA